MQVYMKCNDCDSSFPSRDKGLTTDSAGRLQIKIVDSSPAGTNFNYNAQFAHRNPKQALIWAEAPKSQKLDEMLESGAQFVILIKIGSSVAHTFEIETTMQLVS